MRKCVVALAVILLPLTAIQALGQSLKAVDWSKELIFTQMPYLAGIDGGKALLRFSTTRPTVATVHYGGYPADQDLAVPLFRFQAQAEIPNSGEGYEAELRVYRFDQDTYNMAKGSSLEGVVVYRVEAMDDEEGIFRPYESRFRYGKILREGREDWVLKPCIVEGPLVDLVTDRSAVISIDADSACFAGVRLEGRWLVSRDGQGEPLKARHHEIPIQELVPGELYRYRVEIAGDEDFQIDVMIWPERSFRTAPRPGSRRPFSFIYMSDSRGCPGGGEFGFGGVNYRVVQQFMIDLYRRGADMVLFGGDLVDGYTSSRESFLLQLKTWKKAVELVGSYLPIYEGMGNHEQTGDYIQITGPEKESLTLYADRAGDESTEALFASQFVNPPASIYGFGPPAPEDQWDGVGKGFQDQLRRWGLPQKRGPTYEENVYSFNYDNIHFVSFNTNYWYTGVYYGSTEKVNQALRMVGGNREGYVMKNQLAWLKRDLEAAQRDADIDWIVLFAHEPAFPNGGHVSDAMFWGQDGKAELGGLNDPDVPSGDVLDMRDRFWGLVSSFSKTLVVFFGDEHNYSRTYIDDSVNPQYRYPVWQITSGGAGAPFYGQDVSVPWTGQVRNFTSVPHYCLVEVHGRDVQLAVWDRSQRLVERVALSDVPH